MDQNSSSSSTQLAKWFNVEFVPQAHIAPPNVRLGTHPIPTCDQIPVIDLRQDGTIPVDKMIQASEEYGLFLVKNHGVSEDVIEEAIQVLYELFNLPPEELSKDAEASGWAYMASTGFFTLGSYLWRDNIKHPCYPLEDCISRWPQNPPRYKDAMSSYVLEMRKLSVKILEMISEGLGLEQTKLGEISRVQFITANFYPPCPDPTLTIGVHKHFDHDLITILHQGDDEGLQIMIDGKWIGVPAVPNTFVVNIGTRLQVMSNGKLRGVEHRAVTNPDKTRISLAAFVNPNPETIIEPAKELVNEDNPPLYPSMSFQEFVDSAHPFGPHTRLVQNTLHK